MAFPKRDVSWQVFESSLRRGINRTGKIVQIPFFVCFSRSAYFILTELLRDKGWRQPQGGAKACCKTGPAFGICVHYSLHGWRREVYVKGGSGENVFSLDPKCVTQYTMWLNI